jgi:hypothetical protein
MDIFPENFSEVSEEQRERFHQDIKENERRYQDRWDVNMMGAYCWTLHHEIPETSHKRKNNTRNVATREKDSTRLLNQI